MGIRGCTIASRPVQSRADAGEDKLEDFNNSCLTPNGNAECMNTKAGRVTRCNQTLRNFIHSGPTKRSSSIHDLVQQTLLIFIQLREM